MSSKLLERLQLVLAIEPKDLNGAGATGDYVCLSHYRRCLIVVLFGDGTAGNDIDALLYQATDKAGGSAKVLNVLKTGRIYTKEAASFAALAAIGAWTKETQATPDEQWTPDDSGEQVGLWGFEIMASDLDVANGFDHIRCDISDPSAAKVVAVLYILGDPDYPAAPELMLSAVEQPGSGSVY